MLVDHNPWTYAAVVVVKYYVGRIGGLCLAYFFFVLFAFGGFTGPGIRHPVSIVIEVYGLIEILWYFAFLRYRAKLQRPGMPLKPMTKGDRKALLAKSLATAPDIQFFTRKWFSLATMDQIYRDNVKDWLAWALWAKRSEDLTPEDLEEVEEHIDDTAHAGGIVLRPGRADGAPIRINIDPVDTHHQSLLWYGIIALLDHVAWIGLGLQGFRYYRLKRSTYFSVFPLRAMTLLSRFESTSDKFSYYYRPHGSRTHRPIVVLHGLGIGIAQYMIWLPTIPKDIGIVAIELMNVSNRIAPEGTNYETFANGVAKILLQQNMDDFVLVGHSYGTMLARPLLSHPEVGPRINSLILCDPVSILLHLPDVTYNATRRPAKTAPQVQMEMVAKDPLIAHTLCRRFHWPEAILFREDLVGKRTTAVVAERDCVINGPAVASYIYYGQVQTTDEAKKELNRSADQWTGAAELELFYVPNRDHGQSLVIPREYNRINKVIETYCNKSKDSKYMADGGVPDHV